MSGSRKTSKSKTSLSLTGVVTDIVSVEVEEDDLIDAGWIRSEDDSEHLNAVVNAVEYWHGERHPGPFLWCAAQPCADVVKASGK